MKLNHIPEHITFPASKMIKRSYLKLERSNGDITPNQKKLIKKTHVKRSRSYLKKELTKLETT